MSRKYNIQAYLFSQNKQNILKINLEYYLIYLWILNNVKIKMTFKKKNWLISINCLIIQ